MAVPLCISVASSSPQRTRVRVMGLEQEEQELFHELARRWGECQAVERLQVNPSAHSLLFFHDNKENEILDYALKKRWVCHELFHSGNLAPPGKRQFAALPRLRTQLRRRIRQADEKIKQYTDGEYDLQSVVALAFLGMSVYQTFKRNRFLPAGEVLFANGLSRLLEATDEIEEILTMEDSD